MKTILVGWIEFNGNKECIVKTIDRIMTQNSQVSEAQHNLFDEEGVDWVCLEDYKGKVIIDIHNKEWDEE